MSNFKLRVISSVVGGAVMIVLILMGGIPLALVSFLLSALGFIELCKACGIHEEDKKFNIMEIAGLVLTALWYLAVILSNGRNTLAWGFGIMVLGFVTEMSIYVFTFPRFKASQAMAAIASFIYCPIMLSFMCLIRGLDYGIYLVWMIFVCSWFCDIFAYLVGVKFGKHKFVPKLSPKKSIEGVFGGLAGAAVMGLLYALIILVPNIENVNAGLTTVMIIVIAVIGAMISMIGDLAASAIKRNHGIKDYGNLIPGHGGIMDRFDSVIFVSPVIYVLCLAFLQVIK